MHVRARIRPAELEQALAGNSEAKGPPVLIDIRGASAFEAGHLPGALPIPLTKLAAALGVPASELFTIAGYTATEAEALPAIRPYLRAKYGHLPVAAQAELAACLERLETEASTKRAGGRKSK